MIVAVVGSRTFGDYEFLQKVLAEHKITKIVSGGAKGADQLAERYAREKGIPIEVHLPNWKKYGKGAGVIRNRTIVEQADHVLAFWDGQSRGTLNSIRLAKSYQKPLDIHRFI